MSEDLRKEHDRSARRAFINGISNAKLRNIMTIRGANSLEDAITHALGAENDSLSQVPRNELFCRYCKSIGHREVQCRRKISSGNDLNPLVSALRSVANNGQNNQRYSNPGWNRNFNRNRNFNNNQNQNYNWSQTRRPHYNDRENRQYDNNSINIYKSPIFSQKYKNSNENNENKYYETVNYYAKLIKQKREMKVNSNEEEKKYSFHVYDQNISRSQIIINQLKLEPST